jgi:hypothetical protein
VCRKSLWDVGIELEVYAGSLSEVIANKEREIHGPLRVYMHDDVTTKVLNIMLFFLIFSGRHVLENMSGKLTSECASHVRNSIR